MSELWQKNCGIIFNPRTTLFRKKKKITFPNIYTNNYPNMSFNGWTLMFMMYQTSILLHKKIKKIKKTSVLFHNGREIKRNVKGKVLLFYVY